MTNHSTASHRAQVAVGRALLAIVIIACGTNLWLNVRAGWERSVEAAIFYGLAEAAIVALGAAATIQGKRKEAMGALAACIVLSVACQLDAHLSNANREITAATRQSEALARAKAKLEQAKKDAADVRKEAAKAASEVREDAKALAAAIRADAKAAADTERTKAAAARNDLSKISELGLPADLEAKVTRAKARLNVEASSAKARKLLCRDHDGCKAAAADLETASEHLTKSRGRADAQKRAADADAKALEIETAASGKAIEIEAKGDDRASEIKDEAKARAEKLDRDADDAERDIKNAPPVKDSGSAVAISTWTGWSESRTALAIYVFMTGLMLYVSMRFQTLSPMAFELLANGKSTEMAAPTEPQDVPWETAIAPYMLTLSLLAADAEEKGEDVTGSSLEPVAETAPTSTETPAVNKRSIAAKKAAATRKANAEAKRQAEEQKAETRKEAARKGAETKKRRRLGGTRGRLFVMAANQDLTVVK